MWKVVLEVPGTANDFSHAPGPHEIVWFKLNGSATSLTPPSSKVKQRNGSPHGLQLNSASPESRSLRMSTKISPASAPIAVHLRPDDHPRLSPEHERDAVVTNLLQVPMQFNDSAAAAAARRRAVGLCDIATANKGEDGVGIDQRIGAGVACAYFYRQHSTAIAPPIPFAAISRVDSG